MTLPLTNVLQRGTSRTLSDAVTDALREAIVSGRLQPGEALLQAKLADDLGVSRVPIREALRVLAGERLVEMRAHRGATVARLSLEELDETYSIVWTLGKASAARGVPRLNDEDLIEMRGLMQALRRSGKYTPVEWYRINVAFHRRVLLAAKWPYVVRIVDDCRRNIGRYVTVPSLFVEHVDEWVERNQTFLAACEARDPHAAVAALEVMQTLSVSQVRAYLEEQKAAANG
ncbi:MAG: GntR family transcriptional regulator [Kiloniellales bacterium]